ncbi:putative transcription factor C2H2 family [Lupinus albus]|uniref:E3 ubiquitin-protein ligase RMA n=1 Tax=Lupinus albus TaxID=3870 RepID=A0A6A4NPQ0_LUPAL|nr:putative transcription factor C2H2 family [Lupinus albus]
MMELDLNREPLDMISTTSEIELDSILDELESDNGPIYDRIRHLEAVTSRARERHRWPPVHNPIQITNFTADVTTAADDVHDEERREENQEVEEGIVESAKGHEGKGAYLVAKALGVERDVADGRTGNYFDCNICLDTARDPVVTCCGHLFCWPCFYQLSYAYPNAKECPVCKGEVTDNGIIPIYGNASDGCHSHLEFTENGLRVPPRPRAPRVESVRQRIINQGASPSIIRNVQRFGGLGERVMSGLNNPAGRNNVLPAHPRLQTFNTQHTHSHAISRLLMQGASLEYALNSALNTADRIVDDLESYIHGHHTGRSTQLGPGALNRGSTFSVAATSLPGIRAQIVTAANAAAAASLLNRNNDTTAVMGAGIQAINGSLQIRSSDPSSSYSRRRTDSSRQDSNERRRRRLR